MIWLPTALLRKLVRDLRASYWFVPAAMAVLAAVAAVATQHLDREGLTFWISDMLFAADADAARSVLAVIAQAMLGAAGVLFSMTVVAVTFASTNFGPRLVGNFMQDRGVQFSLGVLLSTFVYALMILRAVRASESDVAFLPVLSMSVALAMTLVSVAVMIYFVHHIPEMISLENLTAQLGRRLMRQIETLPAPRSADPERPDRRHVTEVRIDHAGYIQTVDLGGIKRVADRIDGDLEVLLWPGAFVGPHVVVAELRTDSAPRPRDIRAVEGCFALGPGQTEVQNPLFIAQQMTEIIARVLSPGINDPFTAVTCLDWLHAALHALAATGPVDPAPDVPSPPLGFLALLDATHRAPRGYIADDALVTRHALRLLDRLIAALPDGPRRVAAERERAALLAEARERLPDAADLEPDFAV